MSKTKYPESGAAYRQARLQAGLTQEELAAAVEVNSRRHIIKIENGTHRPRPELRDRIASVLGVDPTSLPAAGEDPFASSETGSLTLSRSGFTTKYVDWFKRRLK